MKKAVKNDPVAKFVTGNKQTKAPKPKSLSPVKGSNKSRMGKFGKEVPY